MEFGYLDKTKENLLIIEVLMSDVCNYKCSYCIPYLNAGETGWLALKDLANFIAQVRRHYSDKIITYRLLGGEPTLYPQFQELANVIHTNNSNVTVISNGSRTIRWWKENLNDIDGIFLSFHPEYEKIEHYLELVDIISSTKPTIITISMSPEKWDYCMEALNILNDLEKFEVHPKILMKNMRMDTLDYTAEQKSFMANYRSKVKLDSTQILTRGSMIWELKDRCYRESPAAMLINNRNIFTNWKCWAGLDSLAVDKKGEIYIGECRVGGSLGHITDEHIKFPTEPTICNAEKCWCLTDLFVKKVKI
jgi:organic radical activating enzyme